MPKVEQKSIDFPVRKRSSVTRSQSKKVDNEISRTLRKRSCRTDSTSEKKEQCSPTKRTRRSGKENQNVAPVLASPKRAPLTEVSPTKTMPHGFQLLGLGSPQRGILTPSKQVNYLLSPQRSPCSVSLINVIDKSPTPSKIRAFAFSPGSHKKTALCEIEPQPNSKQIFAKARALDFSPRKTNNITVTSKETKVEATYAEMKQVTPLKIGNKLLLTTNRHSPRLCSPRVSKSKETKVTVQTGVKKLNFASSTDTALKSPLKSSVQSLEEVRRSPRKLQSACALLQSPRKAALQQEDVRRSPRKHNAPLCLARQEALCYQRAKRALHTALPDKLLCREKQYREVNQFLDKCLDKKQSGSLYISGAPGTGKTAVLSHTLQRLKEEKKTQVIYINCMSVRNSQAIFNRALGELKGKDTSLSIKEASKQLEKTLVAKGNMVCMIMDEVDQLDSKNQDVLYTMFEWPHLTNSRLVLIGIANALDLTDRILPRLQSKPHCKPKLMNFPPYSKDQIVTIITDRLSKAEVEGTQVLDAAAVQFCARKVAAVAGDMRKALDVCRRAIEMVEAEVKRQQILAAVSSPSKRGGGGPAVPKRISVAHIMRTVNEVYGGGARTHAHSSDNTVPLQQKLAICSLLLTLKRGTCKQIVLGQLHENYRKVCQRQEVPAVDQSEFMSLCTLIEARGIMGLKKGKETRLAKVWLKLDEGELERTLQDKTLVSSVLKHGLPS